LIAAQPALAADQALTAAAAQFMFRGEFQIQDEKVETACVPNVEAGKPARR